MNNITNETITLDEIWRVFNEANKDGEYLLSLNDQDKITDILKNYAEAANVTNTITEPVLPLQRVTNRFDYKSFITGFMAGGTAVLFILHLLL